MLDVLPADLFVSFSPKGMLKFIIISPERGYSHISRYLRIILSKELTMKALDKQNKFLYNLVS